MAVGWCITVYEAYGSDGDKPGYGSDDSIPGYVDQLGGRVGAARPMPKPYPLRNGGVVKLSPDEGDVNCSHTMPFAYPRYQSPCRLCLNSPFMSTLRSSVLWWAR